MHLCFVTYGPWEGNPAQTRPTLLGAALIDRGVKVSYLIDDVPSNRGDLGLDPARGRRMGPARAVGRAGRHPPAGPARARAPTSSTCSTPTPRRSPRSAARAATRVLADWDEPPILRSFGRRRHAARARPRRVAAPARRLPRRLHTLAAGAVPGGLGRGLHPARHLAWRRSHRRRRHSASRRPSISGRSSRGGITTSSSRRPASWPARAAAGDHVRRRRRGSCPLGGVRARERLNVRFTGWLDRDELARHVAHAHVALFPIRDRVLNWARCPSKIFAYAQARPADHHLPRRRGARDPGRRGDVRGPDARGVRGRTGERDERRARPDVDYHVERHSYTDRAARFLDVLARPPHGRRSQRRVQPARAS